MQTQRSFIRMVVPWLVLAAAACSDSEPTGTPASPVAQVAVSPGTRSLVTGETVALTAALKDAQGRPVQGRPVQWTSSDAAVATVSATGTVTAVASGTATITAKADDEAGQATITVVSAPAQVAAVVLDATTAQLNEGGTTALVATARDARGNAVPGATVTWSSSAPEVAAVSATGTITALRVGTAVVTAESNGKTATAAVTVTSNHGFDLLYDAWSASVGNVNHSETFRLDVNVPGAAPVRVLPVTYARADVAPSPDGTRIAFVAGDAGNTNIYVANRDGSNLVQLTNSADNESQPAWSADGGRIAYRRTLNGTPSAIWTMNADGSDQQEIAGGATADYQQPTWSPLLAGGTQRIAFVAFTRGEDGFLRSQLRTMRADGSDVQPVTDGTSYDESPTWSPNGQSIVFVRTGGEVDADLWIANAGGGNVRSLLTLQDEQKTPAWSPDGQFVAFTSKHEIDGPTIRWQVYTVRADGSQLVRRTADAIDKENPAWLPRLP